MKIKVVTGESTFFASKNLIEEIRSDNIDEKHYVLVPDRFSLQIENLIMDIGGRQSTFNIEVLGLSRLASRVLKELGFQGSPLNNDEALLLTQQAIENVKHDFKSFKKTSINFAQEVSKVIGQFKSSLLKPEDIVAKGGSIGVQNKYHDLGLIYKEYEELISGRLDANKLLALFCDMIYESKILQNTYLYLVGFDSFTAEMFSIIAMLAKSAKGVYISLAKACSHGNEYIYEDDILNKLKSVCVQEGITIEVVEKKNKLSLPQNAILNNLYALDIKPCQQEGYFHSIVCNSLLQEVMTVGKLINYHIHTGGSFSDVAIACSNLEKYMPIFQRVFAELDIPYFADQSLTADKLVLSNAIIKFLRVASSGFSQEALLDYFSCSLTKSQNTDDVLQNILTYAINGKGKFYKNLSHICQQEILLFDKLLLCRTCKDYCDRIKDFIAFYQENYKNLLEKLGKDYIFEHNINIQAEKYISLALESILRYQAESEISASEFIKKLQLLLSFNQVSSVPTYVDSVMIGDATSSYFVPCKKLFVLGGAENLPRVVADSGLVTDSDIESVGFIRKLEPTIRMLNRRNRFKLFNLLSLAEQELYVFYRASNDDGKKLEKPAFVTYLCQIFNRKDVKANYLFSGLDKEDDYRFIAGLGSKKNAINILASGTKTLDNRKFTSISKALKFDLTKLYLSRDYISCDIKKLFFPKDYTKVTQLECYFSCPFKHFVRYGLKLDEPVLASIEQKDIGNICHLMAELFVKQNMQSLSELNEKQIKQFIESNFDNVVNQLNLANLIDNVDDKYTLIYFIKKQIQTVLSRICYEQKHSKFKPIFSEKNLEGVQIEIGNSNKMLALQGKVDRIDSFGNYFRIIDYKTGKVHPLVKDLYYGDKLQLFIYQNAVKNMLKLVPGGVFYFDCKFDFYEEDNGTLMKGLVAKDDEVISASDTRLGVLNKSDLISVATKKQFKDDTNFTGNALSKLPLTSLQAYASKVASKALEEICEGYILPKPDENACASCAYHGICLYDCQNGVREKSRTSLDDIERCLKGGESDE